MKKSLRLLLFAMLVMVTGSVFATEVTWKASSGDALTTVLIGDDLKLVWAEGGGDQAPKYSGGYVYFYNGNRVTVAGVSDDVKISKVVFQFQADTKTGIATCDASGKNVITTGITSDNTAFTSTWEGTAVNSLVFRATQGTGVRYIESIAITYEGSATPVTKAPVLAITQDNIADTYDMDANSVFVVYYENQGTLAAENAKLTLYVDDAENASKTIGTLNIGTSSQNFWNAKYNLEGLAAGEHQVYLSLTADNADEVKTTAKTVTFTKKAPEPAFSITADAVTVPYTADSYDVVATLTETNNVAATDVKVELRKGVSDVLATQTVATLAAGGSEQVTLTVGKANFETGTKTYNLYVNDKYLSAVDVTFEEAPVVNVVDLEVTGISGSIDKAQESNAITVTVKNNGNVDITAATITLKTGDTVLGTGSLFATVKTGDSNTGFAQIAISTAVRDALEATDALAVTATAVVEGEDADKLANNTFSGTIAVKAIPAPEATFSVTADDVEVEAGAPSFQIKAVVTNTSDVDAADVEVKLLQQATTLETQTIADLEKQSATNVFFTIDAPEGGFTSGTTARYYVQVAGKVQTEVQVTFKQPETVDVIDLAITAIQGTIDQAQDENVVTVLVANNGNVDIAEASFTLTAGETELGTGTLFNKVKAGENGFSQISIAKAVAQALTPGDLDVTATVTVEGEKESKLADNTLTATVTVKAVPAPEADLSVEADDVTVAYGAPNFQIVAKVTNNSEDIDAAGVEVKLLKGATVLETQTIDLDRETIKNVFFTVSEIGNPGTTATYYVQVNNKAQTEVTVTFEEAPVVTKKDLAITNVTAADIDLASETDYFVGVSVENNGNVDIADATITVKAGTQVLGTQAISVKTGESGYRSVTLNTEGLELGELQLTISVDVEGDVTPDDNTTSVTVTVKDTTGISSVKAAMQDGAQVYTIGGQRVDRITKAGLYVVNGRTVVVK